jgi:phenylacetate-CoA ligase
VDFTLKERQWLKLQRMLGRLSSGNAFQRERLQRAGFPPNSLEDFSSRIPFTTKGEIVQDQAAHPPMGSNLTVHPSEYTRFSQTSGTTARPIQVWDTTGSWEWLLENWRRGFQLAGIERGTLAYFAFSFGPFLGFWTAFEAAASMGLRCIPGGGASTHARVRAILEHGTELLCCTPTYALHLADVAKIEGIDLSRSRVRKILVAGEPGGSLPAVRARLKEAWPGSEVYDHYGMSEVGPVAFSQDGMDGALRVLEDRYYVEIISPGTDRRVPDWHVGELVLTPLGREDWPLLRYRTGDIVRARRDADGVLWFEGGVLGRTDDMVIIRGVNVYPGAVEHAVRTVRGIGEYRVTVSNRGAMSECSVEIEVDGDLNGAGASHLVAELEAAFEKAFSLRIPVTPVPLRSLPRFDLKARRWVRR